MREHDRERRRRRTSGSAGASGGLPTSRPSRARRTRSAAAGKSAATKATKATESPRRRLNRRPTMGAGTGGAFKLSSTRRAALLALVACALALSVAVPLRTYLGQRTEIADERHRQELLKEQVAQLSARKDMLSDPAQIEAEARRRLQYVRPGEIPYNVQLPSQPPSDQQQTGPAKPDKPWYQRLWDGITGSG